MAEVASEIPQQENMEVETPLNLNNNGGSETNGDSKRSREDGLEENEAKKQKVEGDEEKISEPVHLGPKTFNTSVEMFDYFYKFLHYWPPNLDVNKYECMVLLDLIKKGHSESDKKVGAGVKAFQVRYHPMWKSRCYFLIREDESVDDFSFRKCVDHILPLPENMKLKPEANKALGGRGGGGRGGGGRGRGGRGRGRGNWSRN
ncbi:hypothetical protein MKW94_024447 [Papaver nudicaule]|uniref:Uncharacterized protein n=1 Tax=Papaver nudicaule TaxID=74823 RepID=A0AA41RWZ6_PAPNU|nr:hypothetical protein [Papaver nudicaule]